MHEGRAVLATQVETAGIVEEYVQVRPGLSGRLDRLLRQVHGPVGVGECAGFLTPGGRGQYDIGELGGLGEKEVLHHESEPLLRQDRADPPQFG